MADARDPSSLESHLLYRLLNHSFSGADRLRRSLVGLQVAQLDKNGSIKLLPSDPEVYSIESRVPVEGEAFDDDGVTIHVLLHVVSGRLSELEIYKEDGSDLQNPDRLRDMKVQSLPTAPDI